MMSTGSDGARGGGWGGNVVRGETVERKRRERVGWACDEPLVTRLDRGVARWCGGRPSRGRAGGPSRCALHVACVRVGRRLCASMGGWAAERRAAKRWSSARSVARNKHARAGGRAVSLRVGRAGGPSRCALRVACARVGRRLCASMGGWAAERRAAKRWSGARSVARNKHAAIAQHLLVILGMRSVRARLATERRVGVRSGVSAADGWMSRIGISGGRCVARRFALPAARTRMTGSGMRAECEGGADDSLRGYCAARARAPRRAESRQRQGGNLTTATWFFLADGFRAGLRSRGAFV